MQTYIHKASGLPTTLPKTVPPHGGSCWEFHNEPSLASTRPAPLSPPAPVRRPPAPVRRPTRPDQLLTNRGQRGQVLHDEDASLHVRRVVLGDRRQPSYALGVVAQGKVLAEGMREGACMH